MSQRNFRLALAGVAVLIVVASLWMAGRDNAERYDEAIAQARAEQQAYFLDPKTTPFEGDLDPADVRYFDTDPALRFRTDLQRISDTATFALQMTDDSQTLFRRIGYVELPIEGSRYRLFLYRRLDEPINSPLFVPFTDLSNGRETYGGGRYLDVKLERGGQVVIDFNLAYNPFCAYNDRYVCPLPPPENHLAVAIRAGEKNFEPDP